MLTHKTTQNDQEGIIRVPYWAAAQPLPHNGLFIRRNNTFGTQLTTGIKELTAQGVMIDQKKIRFDDFVASNTEGIPSPPPNNALAVSYGIAAIPTHQKRDERATLLRNRFENSRRWRKNRHCQSLNQSII